jgi:hypothetical protein
LSSRTRVKPVSLVFSRCSYERSLRGILDAGIHGNPLTSVTGPHAAVAGGSPYVDGDPTGGALDGSHALAPARQATQTNRGTVPRILGQRRITGRPRHTRRRRSPGADGIAPHASRRPQNEDGIAAPARGSPTNTRSSV